MIYKIFAGMCYADFILRTAIILKSGNFEGGDAGVAFLFCMVGTLLWKASKNA